MSIDLAKKLQELFPVMADKIVMIPNGVNAIEKIKRFDQSIENAGVSLLMVGSLIARKQVATALHALSRLPSTFSLTVVGAGPEGDTLKALAAELKLVERIEFTGNIPPDVVSSRLAEADILVMTSTSEGRPNAVLEAMAAGVPVVGSDIPGLRELIVPGVGGMLFPVGDHEALAACLLSLADRSKRCRLGDGGRQFIADHQLTWESTATQYIREFERFCGGGRID